MAEIEEDRTSGNDDEALKRRLIRRIAVAGVLIIILLGGLAVFDALNEQPAAEKTAALAPKEPEPTAGEPKAEEKPEAPAEEKAAEKEAEDKEAKAEPAAETKAEPERTATPTTSVPGGKAIRPLTPPARARPATVRPSEPVAGGHRPDPAKALAAGKPAEGAVAKHAPASRPLSQGGDAVRGFILQLGVFNNIANAEELRAKLEQNGIPSQIEARVQLGPFQTRQEAEVMREKLRALGMETGLLMAVRK